MEEKKVKSDYNKNDFWTKNNNGSIEYYLRVQGKLIEVTKGVYNLYRNDYLHSLRAVKKEMEYGHLSLDYYDQNGKSLAVILTDNDKTEYYKILSIIKDYLSTLDNEYKNILTFYLFEDMNDSQIADRLNISRQVVSYRKKKMLKELQLLLSE